MCTCDRTDSDACSRARNRSNTNMKTILTLPYTYILSESVLFSGTLRYNLDPCGLYDDTQLRSAITAAHLSNFVSRLPGKLSYQVLTYNTATTM
jgi:ABC-type bacteriocin/lantibiotic exporter with double-glycine peptidase domain